MKSPPATLKPATHLSHVLAWRGTEDRTNFAYAQDATITWDAKSGWWTFNSYLNGEKARTALIHKGDLVWKADCTANYFLAVNSGNTLAFIRRNPSKGEFLRWNGNALVPTTSQELLAQ